MKLIINSSPTNIQEWFHLRDQHIRFQRSKRARSFQLETGPKEDRPHGIAMHSNGNTPPLVIDFQFESSRMGKKGRVIDGTSSCSLFFFCVPVRKQFQVGEFAFEFIPSIQLFYNKSASGDQLSKKIKNQLKNIHLNLSELEIRWIE